MNYLDHGLDDLARGEELVAVVALLAHAQQKSFVDLREDEDMLRVGGSEADRVDAVQHFGEIALGVDAGALDAGEDLADDLLPRGGVGLPGQAAQVGQ